jgi:pyruvate/2-oxoglutarate dehydrogenase complex dihydrolipoamide dehydrogenase (E3) component
MAEAYDLIVIGAGAAGLTAAGFTGRVGGHVALIEREAFGGDCTWTGCVPSKALLKVSKTMHSIRTASKYGITVGEPTVDMAKVRDYVKASIEEIYQHETPEVFSENYNVEPVIGEARFIDAHTIAVGDRHLTASKFVIATGARATIPPVPGLEAVPYKTNQNIFDNDKLPEHLLIMGAGAVGSEMAQAHARLGAKVTLMDVGLFPMAEAEVAEVMQPLFEEEGITFIPSLVASAKMDGQEVVLTLQNGDEVRGDMLLVAVGRTPSVNLGLENAGVTYSKKGIPVDDYLRTNVKHIYAVGDCTTGPKFTHYAGFQGGIAGRNLTLPVVNSKGHMSTVPWVIYTDPEIAHAGLSEEQARKEHGDKVKVSMFSLKHGDRTVVEDDTAGFIKLVYMGSGKLLGATIVAGRAGEMIFELMLAIQGKLSMSGITSLVHPYPTYNDVVKKAVSEVYIKELFEGTSGKAIAFAGKMLF